MPAVRSVEIAAIRRELQAGAMALVGISAIAGLAVTTLTRPPDAASNAKAAIVESSSLIA